MVPLPTGATVLLFLGWEQEQQVLTQAQQHAGHVAVQARAYTRGRGFSDDGTQCAQDVAAVIVSAAARSLSNPEQARRIEAGSFNSAPGSLASFSLLETVVLNGHRRRAGGV